MFYSSSPVAYDTCVNNGRILLLYVFYSVDQVTCSNHSDIGEVVTATKHDIFVQFFDLDR